MKSDEELSLGISRNDSTWVVAQGDNDACDRQAIANIAIRPHTLHPEVLEVVEEVPIQAESKVPPSFDRKAPWRYVIGMHPLGDAAVLEDTEWSTSLRKSSTPSTPTSSQDAQAEGAGMQRFMEHLWSAKGVDARTPLERVPGSTGGNTATSPRAVQSATEEPTELRMASSVGDRSSLVDRLPPSHNSSSRESNQHALVDLSLAFARRSATVVDLDDAAANASSAPVDALTEGGTEEAKAEVSAKGTEVVREFLVRDGDASISWWYWTADRASPTRQILGAGNAASDDEWKWPAWAVDTQQPCIEVWVEDEETGETRWCKAVPLQKIVDTNGKDKFLAVQYLWDEDAYEQDFEPHHVRHSRSHEKARE